METQNSKWNEVLSAALAVPGVKINRDEFLIAAFTPYGTTEQARTLNQKRPIEAYSQRTLDEVANGIIRRHTAYVTTASTVAGLPGGWGMLVSIPADMAQFYAQLLIVAQKLAYIYGWPDLSDENNKLGDGALGILTLFVGIAFGVEGAEKAIQTVAATAAKHWTKKLPTMVLTKTAWYPIVKKVAAWLGIKITKDSVGKAVGKFIPLLGGVISGTVTYISFKPMAKRLKKELSLAQTIAQENAQNNENAEQTTDKFEEAEVVD